MRTALGPHLPGEMFSSWVTPCLYCSGLRKPLVQEHFALFLCSLSLFLLLFFSPFPMKTLLLLFSFLFFFVLLLLIFFPNGALYI